MFDNNILQTALANISKNLAPVDYVVVLGYFALTIIIGFIVGGNIKGIKEYAIGSRNFSPQLFFPILLATVIATLIGASETVNLAERVFSVGIIYTITVTLSEVIIYLFIAHYIAPNIGKFVTDKTITMGNLMKQFYGEFGRYTTSITGTVFYLGLISVELLALGVVINQLMGLDQRVSVVIGGLIMISYCTIGGIRAVTFTDVFQFIILMAAIPFAVAEIVKNSSVISEVLQAVPESHIKFWLRDDLADYILLFITWLVPAYSLSPAIVQRFFMTNDPKVLARMSYCVIVVKILIYILVSLVGLLALKQDSSLPFSNYAMSNMILTATPPLIKGFAIAGLIAIIMSTIDSMLNSSGILITHDFIAPLVNKYRKPQSKKEFDELFWARASTIIIGLVAILIALAPSNIMDVILVALMFWNPVIVIPFIAGILSLNAKPQCFKYSTIAVAITAIVCWRAGGFEGNLLHINIILLLVNILVFFGAHWKLGPIEEGANRKKRLKNA